MALKMCCTGTHRIGVKPVSSASSCMDVWENERVCGWVGGSVGVGGCVDKLSYTHLDVYV